MSEAQMALLIPIVFITLGLGTAIVFILAKHRRNSLQLEHRHRERMAAIDRGLDVPTEAVKLAAISRPRYLLRGLIWAGVGLGVIFGAQHAFDEEASSLGWIPFAVGVAYLIFYAVEGRKDDNSRPSAPPANPNQGSTP